MKTKEITIEAEEYIFIPEEDLFTWKDVLELIFGILSLGVLMVSFYVIFYCLG